jgi:hypothetical protein
MKQHIRILSLAAGVLLLASCESTNKGSHKDKHREPDRYKNLDNPPSKGESQFLQPPDGTPPPDGTQGQLAPVDTPGQGTNPVPPPPTADNQPPVTGTTPPPPPVTPPAGNSIPYGKPVPGKKGFVTSPFDAAAGMIDVRDIAPGTKVKDPYTGKVFLVP